MNQPEIVEVLRETDLFRHAPVEVLEHLAAAGRVVDLEDLQVLFQFEDPAEAMYVVLEGELHIFRNERIFSRLGRSQMVGEMGLIESTHRTASGRAHGPTRLLEISRESFSQHVLGSRESMIGVTRTMTRRLKALTESSQAAYEQVNMVMHDLQFQVVCGQSITGVVIDELSEDNEHREFLDRVMRLGDDSVAMIRRVLSVARGTADQYPRELVSLDERLRDWVENDFAMHDEVRRIDLNLEVEGILSPVLCNPLDIKRTVANLVVNAAQAQPDGGRVEVKLRQTPVNTVLEVTDTGPGIPEHILERIFESWFTTKAKGTGLGLSSCREIIERLHGGKLECDSTVGVGTTFRVTLATAQP